MKEKVVKKLLEIGYTNIITLCVNINLSRHLYIVTFFFNKQIIY